MVSAFVIHKLLSAALGLVGNRTWGEGEMPHWVGAVIMAVGQWLQHPDLEKLWQFPALFACCWIFRVISSAPWLNYESNTDFEDACIRCVLLIPLICLQVYIEGTLWPLLFGLLTFVMLPLGYHLAGKQKKYDATAIGEMNGGWWVGLI